MTESYYLPTDADDKLVSLFLIEIFSTARSPADLVWWRSLLGKRTFDWLPCPLGRSVRLSRFTAMIRLPRVPRFRMFGRRMPTRLLFTRSSIDSLMTFSLRQTRAQMFPNRLLDAGSGDNARTAIDGSLCQEAGL